MEKKLLRVLAAWGISTCLLLGGSGVSSEPRQQPTNHVQPAASEIGFLAVRFFELPRQEQAAVVQALSAFVEKADGAASEKQGSCFYGGWTSRVQGRCSSPAAGNDLYKRFFSEARCEKRGFLCSPAFFGPKACLSATKARQKAGVFKNCKREFGKKSSVEALVDSVVKGGDGHMAVEQTAQAVEQACDGAKQNDREACSAARQAFTEIAARVDGKFPDWEKLEGCYEALDRIKGCGIPRPSDLPKDTPWERTWAAGENSEGNIEMIGCAYAEAYKVYRDPGSSDHAYIRTRSQEWILGADENVRAGTYLYKVDAELLPHGDVEPFAGMSRDDFISHEFWKRPQASFEEGYRAALFEISQQLAERKAEYTQEGTTDARKKELQEGLQRAVLACAAIRDQNVIRARGEACGALKLNVSVKGCGLTK